jgi:plasmid maintenance system antidote protein VapI
MPARNAKPQTLSAALRKAIHGSGMSFKALERETGVLRQSLMKFIRGEQSLRLDVADRLAAYFGLELTTPKQSAQRGK